MRENEDYLIDYSFAKKMDLRHLEHVTLPRMGALEKVFDVLAPDHIKDSNGVASSSSDGTSDSIESNRRLTKVVDVTIAYPDGGRPLDLLAIATAYRRPCTTHVHYRVFDINEVRVVAH